MRPGTHRFSGFLIGISVGGVDSCGAVVNLLAFNGLKNEGSLLKQFL